MPHLDSIEDVAMVFSGCVEVDKPSLVFREAEKGGPEGGR